MTIKKGEILEVTITDLAFGGRGLVRIDGIVVFADPAVPGDRVRARVFKKRKRYAEARVIELLAPSLTGWHPHVLTAVGAEGAKTNSCVTIGNLHTNGAM